MRFSLRLVLCDVQLHSVPLLHVDRPIRLRRRVRGLHHGLRTVHRSRRVDCYLLRMCYQLLSCGRWFLHRLLYHRRLLCVRPGVWHLHFLPCRLWSGLNTCLWLCCLQHDYSELRHLQRRNLQQLQQRQDSQWWRLCRRLYRGQLLRWQQLQDLYQSARLFLHRLQFLRMHNLRFWQLSRCRNLQSLHERLSYLHRCRSDYHYVHCLCRQPLPPVRWWQPMHSLLNDWWLLCV